MKKIKQATLYKFREWLYFSYYSLCATAESGVILRILREFARERTRRK